jgi:hypothetical protein
MSEALDYLVSRNLNYRVEYKWVFPDEVQGLKEAGWELLRGRRAVFEPMSAVAFDFTDSAPQGFDFIEQVKMCRETYYAKEIA